MKIKNKLLLEPKDIKPSFKEWTIKGVLNPGAIRLPNKKIALFVRVAESAGEHEKNTMKCPVIVPNEEFKVKYQNIKKKSIVKVGEWKEIYFKDGSCRLPTISHIKKVILSEDGFKVEEIQEKPLMAGRPGDGDYGIEDARIVKIGNKYIMTYVSVNTHEGVCGSIASSKDLENWNRQGITFRQQNKDVFLFPEKIKGYYAALHRPEGTFEFSKPYIWISYSKDLVYWGRDKVVVKARPNSWDKDRIGGGAPPIRIDEGWLEIYHGVKNVKVEGKKDDTKNIYSAGAVLLDLKNPEKIIARSPKNKPLFSASEKYEKNGFISDVVFPTGAVKTLDGKSLLIYSGGSDSVTTVKQIRIKDILNHMEKV